MQAPQHPGQPAAEIHVSIAPTSGSRTRLRLLAASVRANAGGLALAPIVAWVSRDVDPFDIAAQESWAGPLGVEFREVDAGAHERLGARGAALLRFTAELRAPFVIMLDDDMLVTGDLGSLPGLVGDGIGGVVASRSPAGERQGWVDGRARVEGEAFWAELHTSLDLPAPRLEHVHTAWGVLDTDPARRRCPAYLDLGMVAGTADAMRALGAGIIEELARVDAVIDTPARCQLALATMCERLQMPVTTLGTRWNMPNQLQAALAYPVEINDVRLLHYSYEDQLHRERDFGSLEAIAQLGDHQGLDEVNDYLRSEVVALDLRTGADEQDGATRMDPTTLRTGSERPRAEIHVPIAPTEGFRTRVRVLTATVRRFAGPFADAPIVVWVSRDVEPFDLAEAEPWSREAGVEWRWIGEDDYRRWGMYGTALLRFTADFQARYVVMLDADTVVAGSLGELPALTGDGIGGCTAHVSPAAYESAWSDGAGPRRGPDFWVDLFTQAGLPEPELGSVHPGWGILDPSPERRTCPHYFNLGMIAGTAEVMRAVGAVMMDELDHVERTVDTWTRCQLAVALALVRTGTPAVDLGMRWNAPNDVHLLATSPQDASDIRLLHYLRETHVQRDREFGSIQGLESLVARRDLTQVDELLRRVVAAVLPQLVEGQEVANHR